MTAPTVQPALFRTGACHDCGTVVFGGRAGAVAKRCVDCARRHDAERVADSRRENRTVRTRTCADCGEVYEHPGRDTNSYQCPGCRALRRARQRKEWHLANPERAAEIRAEWRRRNPGKIRSAKAGRRAAERSSWETFTVEEIFERDGWVCQLCREPVDRHLKWPSKMSASLDHVVPLAAGGEHTRANTQLAHLHCNRVKGARA